MLELGLGLGLGTSFIKARVRARVGVADVFSLTLKVVVQVRAPVLRDWPP